MKKSIAPKTRKENRLPDTSQADKWLDADRFTVKGDKNIYRLVGNVVVREG